ncbi:hypothetical protein AGMMS49928_12210 [Spirochaetia bacterium]|nr:hypothetical protein AGMMS49928_12210 [Spirochaetia bacterium]
MRSRPFRGLFCLILLVFTVFTAYSEDFSPLSLSLGLEISRYSLKGVSFGPVLAGEYRFSSLAAGAALGFFHDFDDYMTFEPGAFLRWFPFTRSGALIKGLYAEGRVGAALMLHDDDMKTLVMGSLGAGWRFDLGDSWYVEPNLRGGYPFLVGVGVAAGWRPKSKAARQEAAKQEAAQQEAARQEAAKQEAIRQEAARQEAARQEAARQEAARQETARQEAARQEAARQEEARQEAARQEAARQEAARQEAARQEAARQRQKAPPAEIAVPVVLPDGRQGFAFNLTVPFEPDNSALSQAATGPLRELGEMLRQYPGSSVLIQGHAALAGSEEGRQWISRERAQIVADFLIAEGIAAADRIEIQGRGALDPLASNETWDGRQQNRRVTMIILQESFAGAQSGEGSFTDGE